MSTPSDSAPESDSKPEEQTQESAGSEAAAPPVAAQTATAEASAHEGHGDDHGHGHGHGGVHRHPPPSNFIRKWIFSIDHKIIGIQYWFLAIIAASVGVYLSVMFRVHLMNASAIAVDPTITGKFLLDPAQYLQFLTMHGTILVFMVLTTAPLGGFGNYFLPIQIGADDMSFPNLNMASFWITFVSFCILMAAFFAPGSKPEFAGPPGSGWTAYPPLSALESASPVGGGMGQTLWILSIAVFCIASLVGAINFIVTTLDLRCKGMTLMRMPLTCWAWFTTAIVALLSFAVLLSGGLLLLLDRELGTSFFIPSNLYVANEIPDHKGGSPLLFQHLFWFFGHPEVYIAILPPMGIVSHILTTFSRKPVFGYKAMVYALFGIGVVSFFVWGHHMFQSGMSPYTAVAFSVLTMVVGVPSAIKTFNWLGTLWGANIRFTSPMMYSLGFVSLFITGGLGGIFLGQNAVDIYFHDTYFVVGHFHMIMGVAAIFGMFAGSAFWFPKMFGRLMNESLNKVHFWITFVGVYMMFIPMHFLGLFYGHPRRYADFKLEFLKDTATWHYVITMAAMITAAAQFIFLFNIVWSWFMGKKSGDNPWEATNLEWSISSPPPYDNFEGILPTVNHGPYEYGVPGGKEFIMQVDPPEAMPKDAPSGH